MALPAAFVGGAGRSESAVGFDREEGVERRLQPLDAVQTGRDEFARRGLSACEKRGRFPKGQVGKRLAQGLRARFNRNR